MTTNNMSTSDGLNIGYKHSYKSRTTLTYQQQKEQDKKKNLFKVNNKYNKMTSLVLHKKFQA